MGDYGIFTLTDSEFDTAVTLTKEALATQGFGILTEIDVKATMKAKLDVELEPHIILGACNPPFAYQALEADPDIALLLPCNVTIRSTVNGTLVSVIAPKALVQMGGPAMEPLAGEVERRLRLALEMLPGAKVSPAISEPAETV